MKKFKATRLLLILISLSLSIITISAFSESQSMDKYIKEYELAPKNISKIEVNPNDIEINNKVLKLLDYKKTIKELYSDIEYFEPKKYKLLHPDYFQMKMKLSSDDEVQKFKECANKFIIALELAFAKHKAFVISPDMLWLIILQGFSNHVNINAEELQDKFVSHNGKLRIDVRDDTFIKGLFKNNWKGIFANFSKKIETQTKSAVIDLLIPTFTTTSYIEKFAFRVATLKSMSQYFEYHFSTMCGIPKIIIEGEKDDWLMILNRLKSLRKYDLDFWIDKIEPSVKKIIDVYDSKIDKSFWNSILKIHNVSGGPFIDGWIVDFFPYIYSCKRLKKNEYSFFSKKEGKNVWAKGFKRDAFPAGESILPFYWHYYFKTYNMEAVAGFVGARYLESNHAIKPEINCIIKYENLNQKQKNTSD